MLCSIVIFREGELATPGALFWAMSLLTLRVSLTVALSGKGDEVSASYMDVSVIIHTHTCRTIVYNNDAFIYVGNGM